MTDDERKQLEDRINAMSHRDMAIFWRFGKSDDPIIQDKELFKRFRTRFDEHGGMTSELSKDIGWGEE